MMAVRDTGWIQIVAENGQEAVDNVLCAFRIGEDKRVLLPVMVHIDGFHLTHVIEPIILPDQADVDEFLPPNEYPLPLDPARPVTMGAFGPPVIYPEIKKRQDVELRATREVILENWQRFGEAFGRYYHPVEQYRAEGTKILLMTMGSTSETAMDAVDKMRNEGTDVGLLRLRLWRPFPFEELQEAVRDAELLVVVDRAISFGGPAGPYCSEVKSALYNQDKRPKVTGFVAGLGGRDIPVVGFETMVRRGMEIAEKGGGEILETYGVRE
jgi:pyruvate ferredoxin oxidoreductase alpha subunit